MEIFITLIFVSLAIYILYKNFHKSSKGGCSCGSCSDSCPMNKDKSNTLNLKK